ncbi:MAG: hypothetical protein ACI8UO_001438 [Verrucomicrobiales bacterium]|jgi:hypothetical protein
MTISPSQSIKRGFFWLSGAGTESLEQCPNWEQRKYVAYGATVLVPAIFAFIACAYALSTLTDSWFFIIPIALAWSFIILTIDRALLATYRTYQPFLRRVGQFSLRFVVALLMGLTISHPLTLLLFQDTISSVVEEDRDTDIIAVRGESTAEKGAVEQRIVALEGEIGEQRTRWNETFNAAFIVEDALATATDPKDGLSAEAKVELETEIASATEPLKVKISEVDTKVGELTTSHQTLQTDLDHWQREFESEVNGQRSGLAGVGPRARSIRDDQLAWRRAEAPRVGGMIEYLTAQRTGLQEEVNAVETRLTEGAVAAATAHADLEKAERKRVAALKRQVQEEQAGQFVGQQNAIRSTISTQIDTRLAELGRLQGELVALGSDEQTRVTAIRGESRKDLLTQTLALHSLFNSGVDGGKFALIAYLILASLFMLIDTIPLVVKFFSKPGPYDTLVDCEEVRFDTNRDNFLKGFSQYSDELAASPLLHMTANKPLERALIEGVDRSRAAKAFIEHLMDLERSFQERIDQEREQLEGIDWQKAQARTQVLEHMSQSFYSDLQKRMERFFQSGDTPANAYG